MQILDNPPERTTLVIEMASTEKQAHDEPSSTEVSSTTSLPKIPSLARIATQHTNIDEVTTTPVNSPESSNGPSHGDLVQGLEASAEAVPIETTKPSIRATDMEEMDSSHIPKNNWFDDWTFNQHWFYQNQKVLPMALAHLIAARNKANRKNDKEEMILGTNFFVPSTQLQDTADLYHCYNELCLAILDYCDEHELRYREKKYGPQLPLGFRQAAPKERLALSQQAFAQLMESPSEENPWKTFDVTEIVPDFEVPTDFPSYDDKFMNRYCFGRTGHFCRMGVCTHWRRDGLWALSSIEDANVVAEQALEDILTQDPNFYNASKNLEIIKTSLENGLEYLHKELETNHQQGIYDDKNLEKILDGVTNGHDVTEFFPPIMLPNEGQEWPWADRTVTYIQFYTPRRHMYDMQLIIAATHKERETLVSPEFCQLWGREELQRQASAVFIKQYMAERQSEQLERAGWAPPLYLEIAENWLFHEGVKLKDALFGGTSAELRKAIAAQTITYLGYHLYWYAKQKNDSKIKPSDPTWQWQVRMIPEKPDCPSSWANPADPCTQMYNEYKEEAEMEHSLDNYMPPGFKSATDVQRKELTERWVSEIIEPTANYFFSKQEWKKLSTDSDLETIVRKQNEHLTAEELSDLIQRVLYVRHKAPEDVSNEAMIVITTNTEGRELTPDDPLNKEHFNEIYTSLKKHETGVQILADNAIKILFDAEGNYGSRNFRNSNSPAVRLAAAKAVEELDGVSLTPFEDTLVECDDEEDYKLRVVEDVARAMCKRLDQREEDIAKELARAGDADELLAEYELVGSLIADTII